MDDKKNYWAPRQYMYSHIEGDKNVYKSVGNSNEIRVPVDEAPQGILLTEEELLGKEDELHNSPVPDTSTVITRECSYVQQDPVYEKNMISETYEEVIYQVCKDCGTKREISRTTVEHPYVDGPAKLNEDGTYSVTRTCKGPNGDEHSIEIHVDAPDNAVEYVSEEAPAKHR